MNKKQSLRALRRQAERDKKAEKQRQAAAILAPRDLEERKRLLGKAMAECEERRGIRRLNTASGAFTRRCCWRRRRYTALGTKGPGGC